MTTDRSFATECPVCLEELFDENGQCPDEGGVANTVCRHLIHSECLTPTARHLNRGGSRYGVGAFGDRAGCPICKTGVSAWTTSREAAFFPGFWIPKVEGFLKDRGPVIQRGDGKRLPVPATLVREAMRNDGGLSDAQKEHIGDDDSDDSDISYADDGLNGALQWGGSRNYSIEQVIFSGALESRGIWKYDTLNDDLWLWEWGTIHPRDTCATCGKESEHARPLERCNRCADSSQSPCYCSEECRLADRPRHERGVCKTWMEYGPNGSRRP